MARTETLFLREDTGFRRFSPASILRALFGERRPLVRLERRDLDWRTRRDIGLTDAEVYVDRMLPWD